MAALAVAHLNKKKKRPFFLTGFKFGAKFS